MPLLMCPNCQTGMKEVEREGVRIDVCPQCRSVWLDRGELEKLLEPVRLAEREETRTYRREHPGYEDRPYSYRKPKSRWKSILDVFD